MKLLSALALLLSAAAASAQTAPAPAPPQSDEQKWVQQVEKTVPDAELESAAADAEVQGTADPLMALATKYGLDTPPDWLKDRVQGQASAVTLAALGDSVTAAMTTCKFPFYFCPGNSWSSGELATSVKKELEARSGREVRGLLVSIPGVTMKTVPAESFVVFLASVFGLDVQRMTLLIGHNDPGVCGAPVPGYDAEFAKRYATSLRILAHVARARRAKLFVSGMIDVPSVARYAAVTPNGAIKTCAELWKETGRCKGILDHRDDPAAIARARAQVDAFDAALAAGAAGKSWIVYEPTFTQATRDGFDDPAAELSAADCFHPSVVGQEHLGRAAWEGEAGAPGIASFFALPASVAGAPRTEAPHAPEPSEELRAQLESWRDAATRP